MSQLGIAFKVPGDPVGKGRPKFARRGSFVTAYTPKKTADYEAIVKAKAQEAMTAAGFAPMEGPAEVELFLFVTPPASWSQKKQRAALAGEIRPTSKPDIDNVLKGILDAMNEIVWKDDNQVVSLRVVKSYAAHPGAVVEVRPI